MGAAGTKEPPRNVTFENQLLLTEAALHQLQSSVGKDVPQALNTRAPGIDSSSSSSTASTGSKVPLPTIDTTGTVETWRALSSSVNDVELQRLRQEYKQKLLDHERHNRENLNLSKDHLASEIDKLEQKFSKYVYSSICENERSDVERCYVAHPRQVLMCSTIAEKFIKCVQRHREQSLRLPHTQHQQPPPRENEVVPSSTEEAPEQHAYVDPLTPKTAPTDGVH